MINKYKLCKVLTTGHTTIQPVDVNGDPYGDELLSYSHDGEISYAIYENWGDESDEDWNEYEYYSEDFGKARDEYNRLVKEAEKQEVWSYELTVIMRAGCITDDEWAEIEKKIKELDGKIIKQENDGIKRMAYSIDGEERAEFRYAEIELPHNKAQALGSWFNIRHNVLRYLLVRVDDRRKKNV